MHLLATLLCVRVTASELQSYGKMLIAKMHISLHRDDFWCRNHEQLNQGKSDQSREDGKR